MNVQAEILAEILTPVQMLKLKKKLNAVREISVGEFIKEFIQRKSTICKESYINRSVKPFTNKLTKKFGSELPINSISKRDAEDLIFENSRTDYSRILMKRVGSSMWNWGIEREYLTQNIFSHIKLPKPFKTVPIVIPNDVLKKIVTNLPRHLQDIYIILRNTGLRVSELIHLKWENVSLKERIIKVGSKDFSPKSRRIRLVPINKTVFGILSKMCNGNNIKKTAYVFSKSNGFPYTVSYISKRFKKQCRLLNLAESYHLHCLRSTFGSELINKSVSIYTISKLLGHSSTKVTEEHYLTGCIEEIKSAIENIDFN